MAQIASVEGVVAVAGTVYLDSPAALTVQGLILVATVVEVKSDFDLGRKSDGKSHHRNE